MSGNLDGMRFFEYIRSRRIEMILLSIWITILNTYRVFFHVIGVDTEQALLDLDSNLNWTLGCGRFVSAFLRKILMPDGFSYDIAMLLIIIGWVAVCMAYIYIFERMGISNRLCRLFFTMLFVACPLWAEQNYFVCSVFINVYGMLFTVIAACLLVSAIRRKARLARIGISMFLGVLAIGIYQALLYLWVANFVLFLSLSMYKKNCSISNYIVSGIKGIAIIAAAVVIYFCCSNVIVSLLYDASFDYAGYTNAGLYVAGRMRWLDGDIRGCIEAIKYYISNSYNAEYTYGIPFYPILFALVQIFFGIRIIMKRNGRDVIMFVGNALLLICVFMGCLLLGGTITVREQVVLPLLVASDGMFLIGGITDFVFRRENNKRINQIFFVAVCSYIVMCWGSRQLRINSSDYVRYRADVLCAERVMSEIGLQFGNYSDRKVVFVGQNGWELPESYYKGEVIGYSMFSWDTGGPVGVNYRVYGFLQVCGYKYVKPAIEEVKEVQDICAAGTLFSDNNHVALWNEFIVVNLNNF